MHLGHFACLFALFAATIAVGGDIYRYHGADWTGVCRHGRTQSPIDFGISQPIHCDYDDMMIYEMRKYSNAEFTYSRDQNTIILQPIDTIKLQLSLYLGEPLHFHDQFVLHSLHYHWPSEHIIKERLLLEAHYVHYNEKYLSLESAISSNSSDALAVLAVLYTLGNSDPQLQNVIEAEYRNDKKVIFEEVYPYFPEEAFYRYSGSLTTPPCSENVVWSVLARPKTLSVQQASWFPNLLLIDGEPTKTYRELQDIKEREVYAVGFHSDGSTLFGSYLIIISIILSFN